MERLYYRNIPTDYNNNQELYLVGLDVSGIQRYLFNILKNKGSLKEIKSRSLTISALTEYLYDRIHAEYDFKHDQIVTKNSGKLVFTLDKSIDREELIAFLKNMQKDVFLNFSGELNVFYGVVKAIITNEEYTGERTAYHHLMRAIQLNKRQSYALLEYDQNSAYDDVDLDKKITGRQTIEDLTTFQGQQNYLTGIKLDFDNLGAYFGTIGRSDDILRQSEKIKTNINRSLSEINDTYKVFAGGDDIFILVNFRQTFRKLLEVKEKLRQAFQAFDYDFSVSAGVAVFKKKTSIIYYGEKLEDQLSLAKSSGKNGVAIEDHFFSWTEIENIQKHIQELVSRFKNQMAAFSSQLSNIEQTLSHLMADTDRDNAIRTFILKIPQIMNRIENIVPKNLLSYQPDHKDAYYKKMECFYFVIKFTNRYLRKENGYGR